MSYASGGLFIVILFIAVFAVIGINSTIVEIRIDAKQETRQYISMDVEKAASQLESLGNPTRLRIYRILVRAGVDGLAVGGLQQKVEIPASTLSHHCRKLIEAGLVTQERMGTTLICRANYKVMTSLIGYLSDECCADARSFSGAESEHA
jgi:DNA-binding transcriptional ArsR family regulator